jgi:hypothetical protein
VVWFVHARSYIISDSDLIARESANSLQRHIEQQVETDSTLSERLKALQLPSDATQLDHLCNSPHSKAQELEDSHPGTVTPTQHRSPSLDNLGNSPRSLPGEPQALEDPELRSTTSSRSRSPGVRDNDNNAILEATLPIQETFDDILSASRVYDRVKDREIDAITSVSTTRSHAWSVFTGMSLAETSVIPVIELPLYEAELKMFRRIAFL